MVRDHDFPAIAQVADECLAHAASLARFHEHLSQMAPAQRIAIERPAHLMILKCDATVAQARHHFLEAALPLVPEFCQGSPETGLIGLKEVAEHMAYLVAKAGSDFHAANHFHVRCRRAIGGSETIDTVMVGDAHRRQPAAARAR